MDNQNKVNADTVSILTSVLEIFATARSALATYAVAMVVTGGDVTFSLFTTATVELALVLSMLAIGYDVISPVTAVVALGFSLVMQWTEITLLQGAIDESGKSVLRMALAFAPSAILALGILRRLVVGQDDPMGRIIGAIGKMLKRKPSNNGTPATGAALAFDVKKPMDAPEPTTPIKRAHKRKGDDPSPLA